MNVSTGIGTATAGTDYVATNGPVVFAAGVFTNTFNVVVILDNVIEGSETVPLVLSSPSPGVTLGPITSATLTISDNAGTLAFSAANYSVIEDATNAVLTVVRTRGAAGPITVDYATLAGTATPGADYVAVSGTLSFAPGVLTNFIVIPIIDDRLSETAETFTVTIRNPTGGAVLGAISNATLTILDNDSPAGNDFHFDPGLGADGAIYSLVAQNDGKVLIGGAFTNYGGVSRRYLARVNSDGSLDLTFNPGAGPNDVVRTVVLQPDGKVLIGGDFTYVAQTGYIRNHIARLNADGSIDTTFVPNTGADGPVITVALQADGKVLIGGDFLTVNGNASFPRIARLNSSGSLDLSFNPGTSADQPVFDIAVQGDGKIVVAGAFTHFNGTPRNYLARLLANGSLDTGFNPGIVLDAPALALAIQPFDGKIIAAGVFGQSLPPSPFPTTNLAVRSFVARFQTNGALDTAFAPSLDGAVLGLRSQPNGKLILVGNFSRVTGVNRSRVARLNLDGSVDLTFDPGAGADAIVYSVSQGADGKVFVGGDFTHFDGVVRNRIARINGSPNVAELLPQRVNASGEFVLELVGVPLGRYRIEATSDFVTWTLVANVTIDVSGQSPFPDTTSRGLPLRFYRVFKLP